MPGDRPDGTRVEPITSSLTLGEAFAEGPSEIPARGWKDILLRVYHGISEDRILLVATGVTFYALLAIFPGIAGSYIDLRFVRRPR